jgi:S1-C subfamily serine protease
VLASDPLSDLAVVRTERTGLPAAEFNPQLPPIGSLALALGNPLGFENSATAGIVSGAHRAVPGAAQQAPALVDLIQTDAAISPGNSGGALVGADGRLIGINVAYIPPQAGSVSIGFAIPSSTVVDVVAQLLEDGTAEHAWLGIQPVALTPQIAAQYGLPVETGALVADVVPGSPAADAGLEPGDVIVAIDEDPVATVEDLLGALRRREVGAEVVVHVARDGDETEEIRVTLGSFDDAA